jgi:hypothetical protein
MSNSCLVRPRLLGETLLKIIKSGKLAQIRYYVIIESELHRCTRYFLGSRSNEGCKGNPWTSRKVIEKHERSSRLTRSPMLGLLRERTWRQDYETGKTACRPWGGEGSSSSVPLLCQSGLARLSFGRKQYAVSELSREGLSAFDTHYFSE